MQVTEANVTPFSVLTPRECEVMLGIVQGFANKYIAAELGVSCRTVEAHRARIFMKLGVRNAVELTRCWTLYGGAETVKPVQKESLSTSDPDAVLWRQGRIEASLCRRSGVYKDALNRMYLGRLVKADSEAHSNDGLAVHDDSQTVGPR
jgi:DNA-binding CsgD family transcriptional regulator